MNNMAENVPISAGLLEQIVTASSLLEAARDRPGNPSDNDNDNEFSSDEEEFFEDGDDDESLDVKEEQSGVAAVLTELSQATVAASSSANSSSGSSISGNSYASLNSVYNNRPNMTATIQSISSVLEMQRGPPQLPHKVRLSGPIRANVNIRHGVWAPRLRCRKRKNLHAKDGIWIHPTCTLEHLVAMVRGVLPDEFEWDSQGSPLRYQAVNDQSLQSLKTVSGTVASGQSLFAAFDLVRNRRSDGDNFILQLYVYGTWTVLLKPHLTNSAQVEEESPLPPPPKKRYQQAHYTQQLQQQQASELVPASELNSSTPAAIYLRQTTPFYHHQHQHHPLAANPPVTFLPTVTLEMKLNGTFVPVEITRRSFISAFRACSIPKQQQQQQKEDLNASVNNNNNIPSNTASNNNVSSNNTPTPYTPSPPPSDA